MEYGLVFQWVIHCNPCFQYREAKQSYKLHGVIVVAFSHLVVCRARCAGCLEFDGQKTLPFWMSFLAQIHCFSFVPKDHEKEDEISKHVLYALYILMLRPGSFVCPGVV